MPENKFLTPDIIARESLMILQSNTVMAGLVYRDYEEEFGPSKVGDTITIRKPATFEAKEFSGHTEVQDAKEGRLSLTLEKHLDVTTAVTSKQWTLELDDFSARIHARYAEHVAQLQFLGPAAPIHGHLRCAGRHSPVHGQSAHRLRRARRVAVDVLVHEPVHTHDAAHTRFPQGSALIAAGICPGHFGNGEHGGLGGRANHHAPSGHGNFGLVHHLIQLGQMSQTVRSGTSHARHLMKGRIKAAQIAIQLFIERHHSRGDEGSFVVTEDAIAASGAFTSVKFAPAAPESGFPDNAAITVMDSHRANLAFDGALTDAAGNAFTGIVDTTTLSFTTAA